MAQYPDHDSHRVGGGGSRSTRRRGGRPEPRRQPVAGVRPCNRSPLPARHLRCRFAGIHRFLRHFRHSLGDRAGFPARHLRDDDDGIPHARELGCSLGARRGHGRHHDDRAGAVLPAFDPHARAGSVNTFWFIRSARIRWMLAGLIFCGAVVVFVLPIIVAVFWSLVDPEVGWFPPDVVPKSLSLANWQALLAVPEMSEAFVTSFTIAPLVTVLSLALGLPTGFALGRRPLKLRRLLELLVLTPLMLPSIVVATGLGSVFIRLHLAETISGVVLAQTIVVLPFMIRIAAATLGGVPQDVIDAARNLGATPLAMT